MRQRTLPAGPVEDREAGFTLLEVVCVLAIIGIAAALLVPMLPRGTSPTRLQAYALLTVAALRSDAVVAVRRQLPTSTRVDAAARLVQSGTSGRVIHMPPDVEMHVLLPARCAHHKVQAAVVFLPSGMSCGGVVTLVRQGMGFEIRVNWLTGGVDLAPLVRS